MFRGPDHIAIRIGAVIDKDSRAAGQLTSRNWNLPT
jgi:hypothetical protein